jgi:phosphoribosylanthranilate isomerase
MEPSSRPRVKICCIASRDEAWIAVREGASALGLVSAMPSGPGVIGEETIATIAATVPPSVSTFLLTSLQDAGAIAEQQRRLLTSTVQICDRITQGSHRDLRRALPGIGLVQVVHVTGPGSVEEAVSVADEVDAILLDSGNQALAVKELGGTGRRHDWSLSRKIRETVAVPIFLAGGLHAGNVGQAIEEVGPFGLDVCSGVRTDGRLDPRKVEAFVTAARAA